MHVPFIAGLSRALVRSGVATFRYEFPYSEREDFVPYSDIEMDEPDVLLATVRAAVAAAGAEAPDLPVFAGGHSVSGYITSIADSESLLPQIRGVVLLGFPLKGDMSRAKHFADARSPMLFLQGTDDALADADQIRQVVDSIGADAMLYFVESASHGFTVPGKHDEDIIDELASTIADWTFEII
jgi:predicted alpha/beta-hydrolase family hydrolase